MLLNGALFVISGGGGGGGGGGGWGGLKILITGIKKRFKQATSYKS